jgi:transposase
VAARFRPTNNLEDVEAATRHALRSVARRYRTLSEEIVELEAQLERLVAEAAPELLSLRNCSPCQPSAPTTRRRFCSLLATIRRG